MTRTLRFDFHVHLRPLPLLVALGLMPWAASAQTVYRCGPPEARSYSQTPCTDGRGTAIDVTDRRSPAEQAQDRADAEESAQRIRAQADQLEKNRIANTPAPTGVGRSPASLNTPPAPPPAASDTDVQPIVGQRIRPRRLQQPPLPPVAAPPPPRTIRLRSSESAAPVPAPPPRPRPRPRSDDR